MVPSWILILFALILLALSITLLTITRKWRKIKKALKAKNEEMQEVIKNAVDTERKLQKLNDVRSKMYSVIAHDLRNPVNAVLGFSQLLSRSTGKYSEDEVTRFSTIIHKSARNFSGMLENLLEWSKAQNDSMVIKAETFDLHALVLNNFALFELSSYAKNIDLVSQVAKGTILYTDKNILSTILRNLLDNALKFTPQDGQIMVSSYKTNELIQIWVSDNGPGVPPEKINTLFKLRSKGSKASPAEAYSSSGLGLILCKDFLEMLDGEIWVESSQESGSVFKFTLPMSRSEI
jgi:two-component system, sensor histidine kinase and response regulator